MIPIKSSLPLLIEARQLVKVDKHKELDKRTIINALVMARFTYHYAKFYTNKYYIEVAFHRDGTIRISSNYTKSSIRFAKQLYNIDMSKYKVGNTANFIWIWMNRIRKL